MDQCEVFKDLLHNLVSDKLDQFEVLDMVRKYSVNLDDEQSFSRQKYILQKFVLEQLLKEETEESDNFSSLLEEIKRHLNLRKGSGFSCCLSGCLFNADRHRTYLQHLKTVHHNYEKLVCNFKKKCKRQFSSLTLLLDHVRDCHSLEPKEGASAPSKQIQEQIACRCELSICSGKKFKNVDLLMKHMNVYHNKDERRCIFDQCFKKFSAGSTSRHHFRLKHKNLNRMKLKPQHLVDQVDETNLLPESSPCSPAPVLDEEEMYDMADFALLDASEVESNLTEDNQEEIISNKKFFLLNHCDFLNRLCHFKFIPAKTVTQIAEENLQNSLKSRAVREKKLRNSLSSIPNISESQIEKVVHESIADDEYLEAQREVSSEFKRNKVIKEEFKYIQPEGIVMNKEEVKNGIKADLVHYIPIKESFKHLIEDRSLNEVLEQERNKTQKKNPGTLRDFTDGSAFQDNLFFKQNPGSYAAHFYSDAVEVSNPLGWAKGRHKIVQVFYTLVQIPRSQRSQIDRVQLCMVYREKLNSKYGLKAIFSKLVNDLKELEVGIKVEVPVQRIVKMGLLAYSGDNLEIHGLGGYSSCFSSYDICRFCHCQHSDLSDSIHDFDGQNMKTYWSVNEYDAICDEIEKDNLEESSDDVLVTEENLFRNSDTEDFSDDGEASVNFDQEDNEIGSDGEEDDEESEDSSGVLERHGLRWRCPFNQLQSFHAVLGFPPDCMHDLLEGVVSQDLLGGIKILERKGWFSVEEYNLKMKNLGYPSYEASDVPQDVPKKGKKLSGKACSLWVHVRSFPLIVKSFVQDPEDEVLEFLLLLVDITARMTAEEYKSHEVDALEEKIIQYLDVRKVIFESFPIILGTPKPKHHFLSHYGKAIRLFGPPLSFWTARFESKHRISKNIVEAAKNFINISWTVSSRQQYRMASVYYHGMFDVEQFRVPEKASYKRDLQQKSQFWADVKELMVEDDLVCNKIFVNGQHYHSGDLIVNDVLDGGETLKIGLIKTILVRGDEVCFVIKQYHAVKEPLGYYVSKHVDVEFLVKESSTLADNKPLIMRGTETKFQFVLHHYITTILHL